MFDTEKMSQLAMNEIQIKPVKSQFLSIEKSIRMVQSLDTKLKLRLVHVITSK